MQDDNVTIPRVELEAIEGLLRKRHEPEAADALRKYLPDPPMPEPDYLGAVVVSTGGVTWIRHLGWCWTDGTRNVHWHEIANPRPSPMDPKLAERERIRQGIEAVSVAHVDRFSESFVALDDVFKVLEP